MLTFTAFYNMNYINMESLQIYYLLNVGYEYLLKYLSHILGDAHGNLFDLTTGGCFFPVLPAP